MAKRKKVVTGQVAPDFELTDTQGRQVRLSQYRGQKFVLLVLTRGFL
jgi:peroxiredoxin